jgi:hypothetical protein
LRENHHLRAKERFYEGFNRDFLKNMDLQAVAAMEKKISSVHDLLKSEIGYRERVDRMQTQISDMINENSEGRNVLEKALDMLD